MEGRHLAKRLSSISNQTTESYEVKRRLTNMLSSTPPQEVGVGAAVAVALRPRSLDPMAGMAETEGLPLNMLIALREASRKAIVAFSNLQAIVGYDL